MFFKSQEGVKLTKIELRRVKYPDTMRRPTAISRIPPPTCITCIHFPNLRKRLKNELLASAVNINGMAKPSEYTLKRVIPLPTLFELPARKRMEPKIGPTHGVQAAPKEIPIREEPMYPAGLFRIGRRSFERIRKGSLKSPVIVRPKKIMMKPESI
jgi:hypothetical protein